MNTQTLYEFTKLVARAIVISVASMTVMEAHAKPVLNGGDLSDSRTTLQIFGSGFGEKAQAAPILVDSVEKSFENGVLNREYQSLEPGQKVPVAKENGVSIWATGSSGAWGSVRPEISSSGSQRHQQSSRNYYLQGHSSSLGNPVAYGGISGWETPVDERQLYISWWYRPKYEPQLYWRISPVNVIGEFQPQETIDIGGIATATYIGKDSEGMFNIVFRSDPPNTNELLGKKITGLASAASSNFPTEHISVSSMGYETPGSQKYLRVWEDPAGKEGIRFSWTQMHQTLESNVNWATAPIKSNSWNHLELELDSRAGFARLRHNGKTFTKFSFDSQLDHLGQWSPTIALIGLEGKVGKLQEGNIDDIYMDNTLQRVVLGNAPAFSDVTHYEVQRPVGWSNELITVEVMPGSIANLESYYIYVFDKNGVPNEVGLPICSECTVPPARIDLLIE